MGTTLKRKIPTHPCLNCPHKQEEISFVCAKCGKCDRFLDISNIEEIIVCSECKTEFYEDMRRVIDNQLNIYARRNDAVSEE